MTKSLHAFVLTAFSMFVLAGTAQATASRSLPEDVTNDRRWRIR